MGPDMLAYLYVIASAHEEFQFAACMTYDVAFRKKAAMGPHRPPDTVLQTKRAKFLKLLKFYRKIILSSDLCLKCYKSLIFCITTLYAESSSLFIYLPYLRSAIVTS